MSAKIHISEFKIRLTPEDADLLRALARRRDIPAAVLARAFVRRGLGLAEITSLGMDAANRSPA